jgi:DNA-binding transcriptional regulator YdaS (Cro superfamily)
MSHIYVCHFSNGYIKVGRSIDALSRIALHADRVACVGIELVAHHIVACLGDSEQPEAALIDKCNTEAIKRHKSEWFEGLEFASVCMWADTFAHTLYQRIDKPDRRQAQRNDALEQAIAHMGGITVLSRALGITGRSVVHQWRLTRVPAEHCPDVEALTGVRCEELRPDVNWAVLRSKPRKQKAAA